MLVEDVGMDVSVQFVDSGSNPSCDIRPSHFVATNDDGPRDLSHKPETFHLYKTETEYRERKLKLHEYECSLRMVRHSILRMFFVVFCDW